MDAPSLGELGHRLGIVLHDEELIHRAFVHSSFFNENPTLVSGHNERLEFYGDAVIGRAVSRLLYERYPDEDEGQLTARRAALVNREALADLGLALGLDRHLRLGRGEADAGGATRPSVVAGAFEALAGALSLSVGDEETDRILRDLFGHALDAQAGLDGPPKSAKSRLQEWTQRTYGMKPVYHVLGTTGPPHEQHFEVVASLDGRRVAAGTGSSRQRAEERAAEAALEALVVPSAEADDAEERAAT